MDKESPQFAFNIQRILDSVFSIEEAIQIDEKNILVTYSLGLFTNIDESFIQYNVRADFSFESNIFASNIVVTKFGIVNLKGYLNEQSEILWPENSLETMFGIAFNHLRALMSKNMAGSKFSNYIIPLINPKEVFNDLVKNLPEFSIKNA